MKKELKFIDLFSVASGAMISSGLFILPSVAYMKIGPAVFLAYLLAGFLMIPTIFSKLELVTAMPKSGGTYFFIGRSMGPLFGTISGISGWFSLALKSAFALLGIGAFAKLIFPNITYLQIKLIASFFCIIFTLTNISSTKHSTKIQIYLVMFLIIILGIFIFKGFSFLLKDFPHLDLHNFHPFMKGNFFLLLKTAGMIFISFGGLTKIASIAEEVKNPTKNIPLSMFVSFSVVTLIYILAVFITVGILGPKMILPNNRPSLTPLSDAAKIIFGKFGLISLSIAAMLAFVSTANAGIMSASRSPMAMSRDALIPSIFSRLSKKNQTPYVSIIATSVFMISVILFLRLETLVKTASTLILLLFIWVNFSVIIMRESKLINYRPVFKSPLYPWTQIFAIFSYSFLIIKMGKIPIILSLLFIILSVMWYFVYSKKSIVKKDSALIHIIDRITNNKFKNRTLEKELKDIILDRDEIKKDKFDSIIEKSLVIDIKEPVDKYRLFELAAEKLSNRLSLKKEHIYNKLVERENESSTVLTEDIAIPHIIVEGKNLFDIIVFRNNHGINFSDENDKIKVVFIIIGSLDQRPLHMKSLAAIAQIIQNENFLTRWQKAETEQQLKDIIILGTRMRLL